MRDLVGAQIGAIVQRFTGPDAPPISYETTRAFITTRREVERSDSERAARRPRPNREPLAPALMRPKLWPICPAFFAARITSPTKLFGGLAPWLSCRMRPGRT